jgi:hypothetical protein
MNPTIRHHPGDLTERDFYRTRATELRNQAMQGAVARTIQRISEHLRALTKDLKYLTHYVPERNPTSGTRLLMSNSENAGV